MKALREVERDKGPLLAETVLLIVNPTAGGGKGGKWASILKGAIERWGVKVQLALTEKPGSAAALAEGGEYDLLLVAGGDGVFHDAINGWRKGKRNAPVGLIPIGTGNVFATNMGIPSHPMRALESLWKGRVRPLDLGEANGRVFHSILGVGFDAYVVTKITTEETTTLRKRLMGALAYIADAFRHSFRYRWSHVRVEAELPDGTERIWEREAWVILVSNMPVYAGGFKLTPHARPDDGRLDLCLLPARSKSDYFRFALLGILELHLHHPAVIYTQVRSLRIVSEPSAPTQLDGEPASLTPVTVRVLPLSLPVLLP